MPFFFFLLKVILLFYKLLRKYKSSIALSVRMYLILSLPLRACFFISVFILSSQEILKTRIQIQFIFPNLKA